MKTNDLSRGERLLLFRRRKDESQAAAAVRHGVKRYTYRQWEDDRAEDAPWVAVGRMQDFERCFLLRRRGKLGAAEFAGAIGCSRWWLTQMERGTKPADRLVEFWESPRSWRQHTG